MSRIFCSSCALLTIATNDVPAMGNRWWRHDREVQWLIYLKALFLCLFGKHDSWEKSKKIIESPSQVRNLNSSSHSRLNSSSMELDIFADRLRWNDSQFNYHFLWTSEKLTVWGCGSRVFYHDCLIEFVEVHLG